MKRSFFIFFIVLFFFEITISPIGNILGWATRNNFFYHTFKIPYIGLFLLVVAFHLFYKIKKNNIIFLFLLYMPVPIIFGLLTNEFGKVTFSHIYGMMIPILGTSFGIHFAHNFDDRTKFFFRKMLTYSFGVLGVIILFYYALLKKGYINYFGMSSNMGYLVTFFLTDSNLVFTIMALCLSILSGKRVLIVQIICVFLIYLFFAKENKLSSYFQKKRSIIVIKIGMILAFAAIAFIAYNQDLLRRFESLNISGTSSINEKNIYVATGGRNIELLYAVRHISENPHIWLVGGGVGETFSHPAKYIDDGSVMIKHYTHFSPFYFILVYGLPFMLLLYFFLFSVFIKGLKYAGNFFYLVFAMQFIGSFSGAIMMIDTKFWILLGIVDYIISRKATGVNMRKEKLNDINE